MRERLLSFLTRKLDRTFDIAHTRAQNRMRALRLASNTTVPYMFIGRATFWGVHMGLRGHARSRMDRPPSAANTAGKYRRALLDCLDELVVFDRAAPVRIVRLEDLVERGGLVEA